jgi:hypothetical protein
VQARARAKAATSAFESYVNYIDATQAAQYAARVHGGISQLDGTIAALNGRLSRGSAAARASDAAKVNVLTGQRAQLLQSVAEANASNEPSLQVVDPGSAAAQTEPKPKLYAVIAFVIALIIAGRLAFVLSRRNTPAGAADDSKPTAGK